jgi:cell division control protein 6
MNLFSKYSGSSDLLAGDLGRLSGSYVPESFPHRETEIDHIVRILSSIMRNSRPSNILIYGKTGTGKTSTTQYVTKMLSEAAGDKVRICFVNCQVHDSPYSILTTLVNELSEGKDDQIPPMGWPLDRIYSELISRINRRGGYYLLVLDEIDRLIQKNGGDSLYVLLKVIDDSIDSRTSLIGITNDANILDGLEPRIRSRMNQESILFSPYNASDLRDIISFRLRGVVKDGIVQDSAINLCAALGAQEHGDARKALDLMRISIEIAMRENRKSITDKEIYEARDRFEMDVVKEAIKTLPLQSKIVLLSAVVTQELSSKLMITGEIYDNYRNICNELGFMSLTSRRVSDILSELEDFGLLSATTKSMGRYGRTRFIRVMGQLDLFKKHLLEDENLSLFQGSKIIRQSRFENVFGNKEEKTLSERELENQLSNFADADIQ